jgi:hypothetical protein
VTTTFPICSASHASGINITIQVLGDLWDKAWISSLRVAAEFQLAAFIMHNQVKLR